MKARTVEDNLGPREAERNRQKGPEVSHTEAGLRPLSISLPAPLHSTVLLNWSSVPRHRIIGNIFFLKKTPVNGNSVWQVALSVYRQLWFTQNATFSQMESIFVFLL